MNAEQIQYVGRQLQGKKVHPTPAPSPSPTPRPNPNLDPYPNPYPNQVKSSHNDRKWRIRGISNEPASRSMFVDYNDKSISVSLRA